MSVQVVNGVRLISDRCAHQARSVGQGGWVVSFLPGRTLNLEQAVAALHVAEFACGAANSAQALGLTVREAVHLASSEPAWPSRSFRHERRHR
ncbi:hypothetical protein FEK34_13500 [Nocardia cyriacigeorgica]|uniref:Uncharacterized protein n=1 Tax=Nocardia cyriacigeorgica TaxID=135487 RepID=A0A5R8NPA0_9NOCA|nr:hypothetical protein FEK34_13500 [Nocardia cyriacigeorgica]